MNISEFEDSYDDLVRMRGAVLERPIGEIMVKDPLIIDAGASVVSAVDAMNQHRIGCVLVQKEGKLAGIFTERDVLRRVIFHDGNRGWTVDAVMTSNPSTLPPTASIAYALNKMSVDGYRHIPIVDEAGGPIGVVSIKDIVHLLVDFFPESVLNLHPDPDKEFPSTEAGA